MWQHDSLNPIYETIDGDSDDYLQPRTQPYPSCNQTSDTSNEHELVENSRPRTFVRNGSRDHTADSENYKRISHYYNVVQTLPSLGPSLPKRSKHVWIAFISIIIIGAIITTGALTQLLHEDKIRIVITTYNITQPDVTIVIERTNEQINLTNTTNIMLRSLDNNNILLTSTLVRMSNVHTTINNFTNYKTILVLATQSFIVDRNLTLTTNRVNINGINVVIISPRWYFIQDNVVINLSGLHGKNITRDNTGLNGKDGLAGGNGGHFIGIGEWIGKNNVTIISNGGRGGDGQDGVDGRDGVDGGEPNKFSTISCFVTNGTKEKLNSDVYIIHHVYANENCGENGGNGGNSGAGGLGGVAYLDNVFVSQGYDGARGNVGKGGKGGKGASNGCYIILNISDESRKFIQKSSKICKETVVRSGKQGEDGTDLYSTPKNFNRTIDTLILQGIFHIRRLSLTQHLRQNQYEQYFSTIYNYDRVHEKVNCSYKDFKNIETLQKGSNNTKLLQHFYQLQLEHVHKLTTNDKDERIFLNYLQTALLSKIKLMSKPAGSYLIIELENYIFRIITRIEKLQQGESFEIEVDYEAKIWTKIKESVDMLHYQLLDPLKLNLLHHQAAMSEYMLIKISSLTTRLLLCTCEMFEDFLKRNNSSSQCNLTEMVEFNIDYFKIYEIANNVISDFKVLNETIYNDNVELWLKLINLGTERYLNEIKLRIHRFVDRITLDRKFKKFFYTLSSKISNVVTLFGAVREYTEIQILIGVVGQLLVSQPVLSNDSIWYDCTKDVKGILLKSVILDEYNRAVIGYQRWKYPLEDHSYRTTTNENSKTDRILEKLQNLLQDVKKHITGSSQSDSNIRSTNFTTTSLLRPFYTWQYIQQDLIKLFNGSTVYLDSNCKHKYEQAIKFKSVWLELNVDDADQHQLDRLLNDYNIRLKHTGMSYYHYNNVTSIMISESHDFVYSYSRDESGAWQMMNNVYTKRKGAQPILSPYTTWEIKLEPVQGNQNRRKSFNELIKFSDRVKLSLSGEGSFIVDEVK